jgi:hypothetical protein
LDAQSIDESYSVVREVTQFLFRDAYTGLLPWQALSYHVNRMADVLQYESLYGVVQVREKYLKKKQISFFLIEIFSTRRSELL